MNYRKWLDHWGWNGWILDFNWSVEVVCFCVFFFTILYDDIIGIHSCKLLWNTDWPITLIVFPYPVTCACSWLCNSLLWLMFTVVCYKASVKLPISPNECAHVHIRPCIHRLFRCDATHRQWTFALLRWSYPMLYPLSKIKIHSLCGASQGNKGTRHRGTAYGYRQWQGLIHQSKRNSSLVVIAIVEKSYRYVENWNKSLFIGLCSFIWCLICSNQARNAKDKLKSCPSVIFFIDFSPMVVSL